MLIRIRLNLNRLTDNQLVELAQQGDQGAKERLYLKYKGFLVNETNKLVENCGLDFDDTFGSLCYLFLWSVYTYNLKGQFRGYMKYYIERKIKDDIGKRKARMPHVPKDAPFYLRNLNEILIGDLEDD
jgi:DNA-directed RNA polymerase specialized sigma subunit